MAFTPYTDCANKNLSFEQILKQHLLVQDADGFPALKVITANDALVGNISDYRNVDLKIAPQVIKNSAGNLLAWNIINSNTYAVYVKFYNKATAGVVATDVPVFDLMIPANGSVYQQPDCVQHEFTLGIGISAAKDLADLAATDVGTGLMVNIKYK